MTDVIGDLDNLWKDGALTEGQQTSPLSMLEGVTSIVKPVSTAAKTVVSSKTATSRIKQDPKRTWVKGSLIGGSVAVAGVVLILLTRGGGKQVDMPKVPRDEATRTTKPRPENSGAEGPVLSANQSPSEGTSDPEFD